MNFDLFISSIQDFLNTPGMSQQLLKISGVLFIAWLTLLITRRILLRGLAKVIEKTKTKLDDVLLKSEIFHRLAYIPPVIIIANFTYLFGQFELLVSRIMGTIIILVITLSVSSFLSALLVFLANRDVASRLQVKSYVQISRLGLYLISSVIIIATLLGQSPVVLLSGIGALTAVLLLIFKDTILSFVASLQISSYDLVQVGDWIEMPKYNADGDVTDIALHTIKVQNWDKTITVIPTHKLIEESFKNWRGMQLSGGRRIKRALQIDQNSVRFCDEAMLNRFERIKLIRDYVVKKRQEIKIHNDRLGLVADDLSNGRHLTNLGTFRAYLQAYLHNHPQVHQEMTFLIRQLSPGPEGIPMEIYVFSKDQNWVNYEAIQADIFDHIIASLPLFDLRVFQLPTGHDLKALGVPQN